MSGSSSATQPCAKPAVVKSLSVVDEKWHVVAFVTHVGQSVSVYFTRLGGVDGLVDAVP